MAGKLFIVAVEEGMQAGPEAFHAPTAKAAEQKVSTKTFFHRDTPS